MRQLELDLGQPWPFPKSTKLPRKWKVVRSDENYMLSEQIMTDGEIVAEHWDAWYDRMREKYGDAPSREYSSEECIRDFVSIHWATEITDE